MKTNCIDYREMFPDMPAIKADRTPHVTVKDAAENERLGGKPSGQWALPRLIWAMHNGPIPAGMSIGSTCNNPHCVNIAHLKIGRQGSFGLRKTTPDPLNRIREFIKSEHYKNAITEQSESFAFRMTAK